MSLISMIVSDEELEVLKFAVSDKLSQYEDFKEQAIQAGLPEWVKKWDGKISICEEFIRRLSE